jgi:diguanylate cyclase (GGDEF)-like protein
VRAVLVVIAASALLGSLRVRSTRARASLIATALIGAALGFVLIRWLYDGRGAAGAFLVSVTGLLVANFFFIPTRLWWRVGTALAVTVIAVLGSVWVLGRPPAALTMPTLVYGVIILVGWHHGQLINLDRRRLFLRQRASDSATARAQAAEATAHLLFERAPTAMAVVHAETSRLLASNRVFKETVSSRGDALFDRIRSSQGQPLDPGTTHQITLLDPSDASLTLQAQTESIEFKGAPSLLISLVDVSVQRAREQALKALALRDPLTDALNRRGFEAATTALFSTQRPLALLIIDVDQFKVINDSHGHPAGDRVLAAIVTDLQAILRRDDLIGRLGGDEFAVLLVDITPTLATHVTQRILRTVGRTTSPQASLSIGVAIRQADESYAKLLARADAELYSAKDLGGGQMVYGSTKGTSDSSPPSIE